jgi:hypothetical protein
LSIWDWRQLLSEFWAAQGAGNSGCFCRARQVDRLYARMSDRTPDKYRMQHLRQLQICNELSATGQQAPVFAPRNRVADKGNVW